MSTLAEKLQYLLDTKEKIRMAIIAKEVVVVSSTPFRKYADKVAEIAGGGTNIPSSTNNDKVISFVIYPANNSVILVNNYTKQLGTTIDMSYPTKIRNIDKIYSETYKEV